MKILAIKMKTILIVLGILIFIVLICQMTDSFGMQSYYELDFVTGLITGNTVNIRSGPGLKYKIIATANKNEYIRVFAGVGDWYIVQVEGDYVGAISKKYVKPIYPNSSNNTNFVSTMSNDEQEVFNMINAQRKSNGLQALKVDNEVQRVARIKAKDLVDNNYFSHNSPVYGSPFEMLQSFKISYRTAGENIAGNSTNSGAVNAWMNSDGHRANILNSSFEYTGIGVVSSPKYGKIFVQMFIKK